MRTLRLINLHCNKTDNDNHDDVDNTKPDEAFRTVDNGRFRGFGPESMMNRSDWNVNADIQFNEQAVISFYDEDLVRNLSTIKHPTNHIVKENEIQDGLKKVSFATSNANYVLSYEIL
ncbi:MAG TPA: hypothetical protein VJ583_10100 [Nitrososphaeraceae archaeon]|nr:hypothetical protein [Nitrososphaeraceae archaeon]